MSNYKIGIGIGNTNSSVGIMRNNSVDIVPFSNGGKTIPSCVYFNPNSEEIVVGSAAKGRRQENVIYDTSRIIGSKYDDYEVQDGIKNWPFKVINDNGYPKIEVKYNKKVEHYSPLDISTIILKSIKKYADEFLGKDLNTKTKTVITVPAYFNNKQRENTKKAAEAANLEVIKIINESTAAVIAYAKQRIDLNNTKEKMKILVFDFGGGKFDISLIELDEKKKEINVLGTDGDSYLGGEDIDNIIVNYYNRLYKNKVGKELSIKQKMKLKKECEKSKEMLSSICEAYIDCDFLEDVDIDCSMQLSHFNKLIEEICNRIIALTEGLLSDMKLEKKDIDKVILMGGSSNIIKVKNYLTELFGKKYIYKDINSSEGVAIGATIVANFKEFDYKINDIITHSLSTDDEDDKLFKMIKKNTPIPCEYSQKFANYEDNQEYINIDVYEGEGSRIGDKKTNLLGNYKFEIPRAPARSIIITIKYKVDENGIIHIYGKLKDGIEKELITI